MYRGSEVKLSSWDLPRITTSYFVNISDGSTRQTVLGFEGELNALVVLLPKGLELFEPYCSWLGSYSAWLDGLRLRDNAAVLLVSSTSMFRKKPSFEGDSDSRDSPRSSPKGLLPPPLPLALRLSALVLLESVAAISSRAASALGENVAFDDPKLAGATP